ncbi:MAG: hypothetical protein ABEJ87_01325 [Candidatus Nanohalobium sp.]
MPSAMLQSLPPELTSFLLVALLIAVLVIAYKIMEMVFETLTVAALSGVFYAGLTYLFSGGNFSGFQINQLLLFIFLGAGLYMLYSFIISLYHAGTTLIEIPLMLVKATLYPFKKIWRHHRESKKEKKQQENQKTTKEVVLDKTKDEDDDEE